MIILLSKKKTILLTEKLYPNFMLFDDESVGGVVDDGDNQKIFKYCC